MDSWVGSAHGPAHTDDINSTGLGSSNPIQGLVCVSPLVCLSVATSGGLSSFDVWLFLSTVTLGTMHQILRGKNKVVEKKTLCLK